MTETKELISIHDAAKVTGIPFQRLYELVDKGVLVPEVVANRKFVTLEAVEAANSLPKRGRGRPVGWRKASELDKLEALLEANPQVTCAAILAHWRKLNNKE